MQFGLLPPQSQSGTSAGEVTLPSGKTNNPANVSAGEKKAEQELLIRDPHFERKIY